jgi:hypothetical protein
MRKFGQAQERRNQAVGDQALGVFDPADPSHNAIDMGQEQVGGMIPPVIVIGPANRQLQKVTNCKCVTEALKQTEAAKASQTASFEGEMELSRAFGHASQMYPMGSFVRTSNRAVETRCSSMAA